MSIAGLVAVGLVLALAAAFGLWRRRVDGRFRATTRRNDGKDSGAERLQRLTAAELGQPLGVTATLVQFSSAFCQPCRATRKVLDRVTGMVSGVVHVEIDAEERLDLTRALSITRTPTVFVLDSAGLIRHRAVGQPTTANVIAALGEFVPAVEAARQPRGLSHMVDPAIDHPRSST